MPTKPIAERRSTDIELLNAVKEINDTLSIMRQQESARLEREKHNDAMLIEHEKSIKGNGKPGLQTDMQLVKDNLTRINWIGAIVTSAIIIDLLARIVK